MRLDLVDLRLFAHIVDAGSITAGAAKSAMTLASASERVRALETRLGVRLLEREVRGVRPTAAGRTLSQHARAVLRELDALEGDLLAHGPRATARIRFACNTSAWSAHLPDRLGAFLVAHPRVSIDLEERTSTAIVAALEQETVDLGVVSDAVDLRALETVVLGADPLVLVVAAGDALAERRSMRVADAAPRPFIGLGERSALEEHVVQQTRRLGRPLAYRVRLDGFEAVCRMVGLGVGVAIVPRAVARRHARASGIRAIALTDRWADRRLVLCARSFDALSAPARRLVDALTAPGR